MRSELFSELASGSDKADVEVIPRAILRCPQVVALPESMRNSNRDVPLFSQQTALESLTEGFERAITVQDR